VVQNVNIDANRPHTESVNENEPVIFPLPVFQQLYIGASASIARDLVMHALPHGQAPQKLLNFFQAQSLEQPWRKLYIEVKESFSGRSGNVL